MKTIERGEAKADYKRNKTLAKIQEKRNKHDQIQAERAQIAAQRAKLREEIEHSKKHIVQ